MGKKKRGHPDVEEILSRPWCYYCERDFEDLKLLISHQKAKHFKCDRCGKRLNTAGGLSVHMNQVHKETLTTVENALPNRQGLEIEIFGMEGVPEDILQQHQQRIISNFYTAQAERRAATGNPPPGVSGEQGPAKKIKIETPEEIKKRLAEHRAKVAAQKANGGVAPPPADGQSPAQGASPFPPPQTGFPYPPAGVPGAPPVPGVPGAPPFPAGQAFPPTFAPGPSPPPGAPSAFNLPSRPPGGAAVPPPGQPYYYNGAGAPPPGYPGAPSTVDELVAGAARQADDIDHLIRMAEKGIKPAKAPVEEAGGDKKSKKEKEKNMRMIYADTDVSPEEKMALLPKYRFEIEA